MKLPQNRTPPTETNPKILLLYGLEKVGKTSFASELDNNIIVDIDNGGTKYTEALKIEINSLKDLHEFGKSVLKHKSNTGEYPYKYLTLDTVSVLNDWCELQGTLDYMSSPMKAKGFNDGVKPGSPSWQSVVTLPNGAGWWWPRKAFFRWIEKLTKLAPYIILIGHVKDKFIYKDDHIISDKELSLTGISGAILMQNYADAIGYMYRNKKTGELRINFGGKMLASGSNCDHLSGIDIKADWSKIYIE